MDRNLTIRMKEDILKKCRFAAVEEDMSLSQWVAAQLEQVIRHREVRQKVRERAIRRLEKGLHLGGRPIDRDAAHER